MADPQLYRWTLDEYILRCEQGTDVREIVVEGELDRDFISDALKRWGAGDVTVIDADYIEVSADEVTEAGFNVGVKGRLLTLAAALDRVKQSGTLAATVAVIVDRDYDETLPDHESLLVTDGYSLESYALSTESLDRFARLVLGRAPLPAGAQGHRAARRTPCTGKDLHVRLIPALVDVAAVRLTLLALDDPPRLFPRWLGYVSVATNGTLTVRAEALLSNVLDQAGLNHEYESAAARLAEEKPRVAKDVFRLVRGHDFIDVLHKLLTSPWGRRVSGGFFVGRSEGSVARLLLISLDPSVLDATDLFAELRRRLEPPSPPDASSTA